MTDKTDDQVAALIQRAYMFLDDGEWERVDEYAERALDIAPTSSEAYLLKLLNEMRIRRKENLRYTSSELSSNRNFLRAVEFADPAQKEFLLDCEKNARNLSEKKQAEQNKQYKQDLLKEVQRDIATLSYRLENPKHSYERDEIRRGRAAAIMYLIAHIVFVGALVFVFLSGIDMIFLKPIFAYGGLTLLLIAYVFLAHHHDGDGWGYAFGFGIINWLTLGIMRFVKAIKEFGECRDLKKKMLSSIEHDKKRLEELKETESRLTK